MKHIITDDPQTNTEVMFNLAYVKDKEVWIRGGDEKGEDCTLIKFAERMCQYSNGSCHYVHGFPSDIVGTDIDAIGAVYMDCSMSGCPIGTAYFIAIQAAELRERVRKYEEKEDPVSPRTRTNKNGFKYWYCGKCGHQLPAGWPKRCDNCGQAVKHGKVGDQQ